MKAKQLAKKLSVNKETIANLYNCNMMEIRGGVVNTADKTLDPCTTYEVPCDSRPVTKCMC